MSYPRFPEGMKLRDVIRESGEQTQRLREEETWTERHAKTNSNPEKRQNIHKLTQFSQKSLAANHRKGNFSEINMLTDSLHVEQRPFQGRYVLLSSLCSSPR